MPRPSLKWKVTYRIGLRAIPDSFSYVEARVLQANTNLSTEGYPGTASPTTPGSLRIKQEPIQSPSYRLLR